ncbi:MAG: hypothetical protein V2I54_09030 [Bacteroidales bacterium]|jgi:hypothetical protein|nr:hypothetical protein [Bacteroidales bacterium]
MKVFRWMLFFMIFSACQEEQEFDYPLIHTGGVTHIDSTGATFSARLVDVSKNNITAYGFVWGTEELPDIHSSRYMIQLPTEPKIFTARIFYDLYPNQVYSVRAFAMNDYYICYGLPVKFISKGCSGAVANFLQPLSTGKKTIEPWSKTSSSHRFGSDDGIISGSRQNPNPTRESVDNNSKPGQLITTNPVP